MPSIIHDFVLRNEFNRWNVHGIMNTSGLLQETRSIQDSVNRPTIELIAYIYIPYKYLEYKKYL